jgi:hypothetical protein
MAAQAKAASTTITATAVNLILSLPPCFYVLPAVLQFIALAYVQNFLDGRPALAHLLTAIYQQGSHPAG